MGEAQLRLKHLLLSLCATGVVFLFCFTCYGSYSEEYQSLFNSFLSQAFSPGTLFNSWYYQGYIGISFLYAQLYIHFPRVEWVSWLSFLYLFIAAWGMAYYSFPILLKQGKKWMPVALLFFVFILLADNLLHFQNARVAYLLCGSALLISIIRFPDLAAVREQCLLFLVTNFLYLLGCLSRSEPGMGMLFLFVPFAFLWHQNLKSTILSTLVPVLISSFLFLFIMADLRLSDEFHKRIEPDVEMQLTVRDNIVPLSDMKTATDSMKYEAAKNMLWGDPRVLDEKFLRSLIADAPYLSVSVKQITRTLSYCLDYIRTYFHLLAFAFVFLFLSSLRLYKTHTRMLALLPLLYFFVFIAAIFLQSFYVKMRDWSFSPYAALFLASCVLYFFKTSSSQNMSNAGLLLLIAAGVLHHYFVHAGTMKEEQMHHYNKALYSAVKEVAGNETLLLNPSSYQNFLSANRPFEPINYSDFDKLFFYESQIASVLPGYRDYLMKECSCDVFDFSQFYRYLLSENYPHTVYALSTQRRMDLIQRYLKTIHFFNLAYREVPEAQLPQNPNADRDLIHLYVLSQAQQGEEKMNN